MRGIPPSRPIRPIFNRALAAKEKVLRSSLIQIGQGVLELSCAQDLRSMRGTPPSLPIRPIFNRALAANKSSVASKFHSNPLISRGDRGYSVIFFSASFFIYKDQDF